VGSRNRGLHAGAVPSAVPSTLSGRGAATLPGAGAGAVGQAPGVGRSVSASARIAHRPVLESICETTRVAQALTLEEAFELLGLPESSTDEEMEARTRELAFSLHPDRPRGDPEKFRDLQEAKRLVLGRRQSSDSSQ
jgi:DnaJ domain